MQEVKASIVLDRLSDAENITVSDNDLDRELLIMSIQKREPLRNAQATASLTMVLSSACVNKCGAKKTAAHLFEKLASVTL